MNKEQVARVAVWLGWSEALAAQELAEYTGPSGAIELGKSEGFIARHEEWLATTSDEELFFWLDCRSRHWPTHT